MVDSTVAVLDLKDASQLRRPVADLAWSCTLDSLDFVGASIFLVGCVTFLPSVAEDPNAFLNGCLLFIVGAWLYIALGIGILHDAVAGKGLWSAAAAEGLCCIEGGACFFIGTLLFLPSKLEAPSSIVACVSSLKKGTSGWGSSMLNLPGNDEITDESAGNIMAGTMFYIIGALGFSLSAFANALGLTSIKSSVERLSALSSILHMCGGLFFCLGSMGFIAQVGCDKRMVAIGAWCYIVGCTFYIIGAAISLMRNFRVFKEAYVPVGELSTPSTAVPDSSESDRPSSDSSE